MNDFTPQRARRSLSGHNLTQFATRAVFGLSFVWWSQVYWVLISPSWGSVVGPEGFYPDLAINAAIATAMVFMFALVLTVVPPVFISALIPSTAANMLLSKLQARYSWPGFLFGGVASIWLTLYAYDIIFAWWAARPVAVETNLVQTQSILTIFVMFGFTAWALNRVTPEQWIDLVTQARDVRRIERAMQLEDDAMKAAHARAIALINADLTRMTAGQIRERNQELASILGAFARAQAQALTSVASSWKSLYGVELATQAEPDETLTARYRQVARLLDDAAGHYVHSADAIGVTAPRAGIVDAVTTMMPQPSSGASERVRVVREATVTPMPADARRDEPRRADAMSGHDYYTEACRHLPPVWTVKQLAELFDLSESRAREYRAAWEQAGLVTGDGLPNGRYKFTEGEVTT